MQLEKSPAERDGTLSSPNYRLQGKAGVHERQKGLIWRIQLFSLEHWLSLGCPRERSERPPRERPCIYRQPSTNLYQ